MKKRLFLLITLPVFIYSCSKDIYSNNKGNVSFSVKFPVRNFSIKSIPDQTEKIELKITGKNIVDPIFFELNRNNPKINTYVVEGNTFFEANALDKKNRILASGSEKKLIRFYLNTKLSIVLGKKLLPVAVKPTPVPDSIPVTIDPTSVPVPTVTPTLIPSTGNSSGQNNFLIPSPSPTPSYYSGSNSGNSSSQDNSNQLNIDIETENE